MIVAGRPWRGALYADAVRNVTTGITKHSGIVSTGFRRPDRAADRRGDLGYKNWPWVMRGPLNNFANDAATSAWLALSRLCGGIWPICGPVASAAARWKIHRWLPQTSSENTAPIGLLVGKGGTLGLSRVSPYGQRFCSTWNKQRSEPTVFPHGPDASIGAAGKASSTRARRTAHRLPERCPRSTASTGAAGKRQRPAHRLPAPTVRSRRVVTIRQMTRATASGEGAPAMLRSLAASEPRTAPATGSPDRPACANSASPG